MLEGGYIIPFTKAPAVYEEPNNSSANKDPVFVHQAATELATLGIIQFTKKKPHCVSPLTVSHKRGRDGSIKKKLCWGGSSCVTCVYKNKRSHSHISKRLWNWRDLKISKWYMTWSQPTTILRSTGRNERFGSSHLETRGHNHVFYFSVSSVRIIISSPLHHKTVQTDQCLHSQQRCQTLNLSGRWKNYIWHLHLRGHDPLQEA